MRIEEVISCSAHLQDFNREVVLGVIEVSLLCRRSLLWLRGNVKLIDFLITFTTECVF